MSYEKGLREVGPDVYAWLQPDGGWGLSNAGLIVDGGRSLLVDTLFDLALTSEMLAAMRDATPAAGEIGTLVNTHANGDHTFGNQLVGGAEIVASRACADELGEAPPQLLAGLMRRAPEMGHVGAYLEAIFGRFTFDGITLVPPTRTFSGELILPVGDTQVRLIEVGPAHTRGDVIVHVPARGVVFTADIVFVGGHPMIWAGPVRHWIRALDIVLGLDVEVVVPGHGPLTDKSGVRELRGYFEALELEARRCWEAGMTPRQAAREARLDQFGALHERERLVANVMAVYRELESAERPSTVEVMTAMSEFWRGRGDLPAQSR